MMGALRALALGVLALQVAGCASGKLTARQQIALDTPGVEQATCQLQNSKLQQPIEVRPPKAVTVPRAGDDLSIACQKDGYHPAYGQVKSGFNPTTVAVVLLGGLGALAADVAMGGNHRYPASIHIYMTRFGEDAPDNEPVTAEQTYTRRDVVAYAPGDRRNEASWDPMERPVAKPAVTEPDAESQRDVGSTDIPETSTNIAVLRDERDEQLRLAADWDQRAARLIHGATGSTNDSVDTDHGGTKRSDRWIAALRKAGEHRERAAEIDAWIVKLEAAASKATS